MQSFEEGHGALDDPQRQINKFCVPVPCNCFHGGSAGSVKAAELGGGGMRCRENSGWCLWITDPGLTVRPGLGLHPC